jgi:hypothetical protein
VERTEGDYQFPKQPEFDIPVYGGVLNAFEYCVSLGKVDQARIDSEMAHATSEQAVEFAKGLLVPFVSLWHVLSAAFPNNPKTNLGTTIGYVVVFYAWVGVAFASVRHSGLACMAWILFVVHGVMLATIRSKFRQLHNIRSNAVADLMASALFWPQVMTQMRLYRAAKRNDEDEDSNDNFSVDTGATSRKKGKRREQAPQPTHEIETYDI